MKLVALDLSLTASGFADSDGNSGVLRPPKGWSGAPRLAWIRNAVLDRTEGADLVIIEGYAYGRENQAHQMGELGGVVRLALFDESRDYVEIAPASVKLFATGKGNAPKDEVFAAAIRQLHYTGASHDEADALWLLELARTKYAGTATNEARRRAIEKVAWPVLKRPTAAAPP